MKCILIGMVSQKDRDMDGMGLSTSLPLLVSIHDALVKIDIF